MQKDLKPKEFKPLKDQEEAFSKEIILERLLKDEAYLKRRINSSRGEDLKNYLKELKDIKIKIKRTFDEANHLWYFKP